MIPPARKAPSEDITSNQTAIKEDSARTNKLTQQQPRTLAEAQLELALIRPRVRAPLLEWLGYYQRSAALYAEIAEIDRGHHHEALHWAEHEQNRLREIKAQISTQQRTESDAEANSSGENRDAGATQDVDAGP
jgi:hypothetical protein